MTKTEEYPKIKLSAARVNAGLTQSDVAKMLKVSKGTVVNWECGRTCPSVADLIALGEIYKFPYDLFFLP